MPIVLSTNQVQINMNGSSLPNAGVRIFNLGTAIPGTSTLTTFISFTHNGTAGTGISMRWYFGAGRQSGTIAENFWVYSYAAHLSTATTWTLNFGTTGLYSEGNGIISGYGFYITGTKLYLAAQQIDTGAWLESYVEAYSSNWDRITVAYS